MRPQSHADTSPESVDVHVVESSALTPQMLAVAFTGEFRPVRLSPLYHLWLLIVACVMLLLPLAYLGLVAALGYGVYYHAVNHYPGAVGGRITRGTIFLYVMPLVAGAVVVLFLLKPLFAPRRRMSEPLTVQPDQEPLLTQYVEQVCRVMNAPVPKRIDVDAQPNASASFRRGLLSLFSNDLVLTIGLPLVAALDLRQLTGVLAHELGHFRQGFGMRLTYIIHRVNWWFARVVYERDAWDDWLDELPNKDGMGNLAFIVMLVKLCVGMARGVLWVLMHAAHAVSCVMSRQMEYDADRCEVQMAGSEDFAKTSREIVKLGVAWKIVLGELQTCWAERRLPDDLPAFIAGVAERLPKKAQEEVEKELTERKTPLFSTHPPTVKRIEAAKRLNEPGIFALDVPAWAVFRDFPAVCKQATYIQHRIAVGKEIFQATMVPTAGLLAELQAGQASGQAFERYFPGSMTRLRPIFPEVLEIKPPRDPKAAAMDLQDARRELEMQLPDFEQAGERYKKVIEKLIAVRVGRDLVGAGLKPPREAGVARPTSEAMREAVKQAEQARESIAMSLEPGLAAARRRLICALQLLYVKGIDKRLPQAAAYRQRIPALLLALGAMRDCRDKTRELRIDLMALITLIMRARGQERNELFYPRVREVAQRVERSLASVIAAMHASEYPYEHSRGTVSIAEVLRTGVPANADYPVELAENAEATLDGLYRLYFRMLSELAAMAEQVESLLKLEPIKGPKQDETDGTTAKKKAKRKKRRKEEEEEVLQPV